MSTSWGILRSRPAVAFAIGAFVFATAMGLRLAGLFEALEIGAYDRFLRRRPAASMNESPLVLVRIHEEDIRRFGHPVSDELLTEALAILTAAEPRAIGVDLYRDAPVPREPGRADRSGYPASAYVELGKAVTKSDRIVMVTKIPDEAQAGIPPPSFLEGTSQVGFSDLPVDPGGTVRRGLLFLWVGDTQYLSLSLQLALRYLRDEGIGLTRDPVVPDHVRIGKTTVPPFRGNDGGYVGADDGGYQLLLDYRLGTNSFPSFSFQELLANEIPQVAIRDRIVIVGTTAPSVKDNFYSPYSQVLRESQEMHGIEVHAHAVSQLLRIARGEDRPIASVSELGEGLWILLWSLLGAGLGFWNRATALSLLTALAGTGALLLAGFALFTQGWWIPVVPPALAGWASVGLVIAYVAAAERAERRAVTRLFSRFVGPEVVKEIWKQRDQFLRKEPPRRPRSRWITLTVLMSDLEGYTSAAEKMDPYVLMGWINEFMTAAGDLVGRHYGVVDDYAGDGIKANFGFPVPRQSEEEIAADAVNAVRCALAMGQEMENLNERWRVRNLPCGRVRVGIFTGPAVVGILGGEQSLKFTSVGDTVNTAARLESFDKDGFSSDSSGSAWRVLIGEETLRLLGGAFRTIDLGSHALRGKDREIGIHRVLGPSAAVDAGLREEKEA